MQAFNIPHHKVEPVHNTWRVGYMYSVQGTWKVEAGLLQTSPRGRARTPYLEGGLYVQCTMYLEGGGWPLTDLTTR